MCKIKNGKLVLYVKADMPSLERGQITVILKCRKPNVKHILQATEFTNGLKFSITYFFFTLDSLVSFSLFRQGYVNDKVPVEVLIEKYLRMEQRKLLIPIATSGNVVFPKRKR